MSSSAATTGLQLTGETDSSSDSTTLTRPPWPHGLARKGHPHATLTTLTRGAPSRRGPK
jgi:hypothetical protein